jgi:acetolactate synthase I/II/III large subunit
VQVLADEGVDTIFGYSGGAILPTYDAVFRYNEEHAQQAGRKQMPLIVPANEQGAGFMAAGYARASGKVGVCLVTSGPGATNTVTPVRDCMADSVPIVVICGQVPTRRDRHRRVPGSAGLRGSWARSPSTSSWSPTRAARGDDPHRVRDRAHRPPGARRRRHPEGRAELEGRVPRRGALPIPGYRQRMSGLVANTLDEERTPRSSRCSARRSGR